MSVEVTPFLWYSEKAEEAAQFYADLIPNSRVVRIYTVAGDNPSGPEGAVKVVEFTLAGRRFQAMTAGRNDPFNQAVSFMIECDTQAEIDRYWNALLEGGEAQACGWLKDRYGLSWQITPRILLEYNASKDRDAARRATEAMMRMVKLDIATLKAAYAGN